MRYYTYHGRDQDTAHLRDIKSDSHACGNREFIERAAACLNALEGIDLSTLRDGWLADLMERAEANQPECQVGSIREANGL